MALRSHCTTARVSSCGLKASGHPVARVSSVGLRASKGLSSDAFTPAVRSSACYQHLHVARVACVQTQLHKHAWPMMCWKPA
jgi:hypothetical protein